MPKKSVCGQKVVMKKNHLPARDWSKCHAYIAGRSLKGDTLVASQLSPFSVVSRDVCACSRSPRRGTGSQGDKGRILMFGGGDKIGSEVPSSS